jgi:hypothetical protein
MALNMYAIVGVNRVHLAATFSRSVREDRGKRQNSRLRISVVNMKGPRIRAKRQ